MPRYVITIAPDNGAVPADGTTNTTIRVDASSGRAKVTELTIQGGPDGLAPADLPMMDLDLLVRALSGGQRISRAAPTTSQALTGGKATAPAGKATAGKATAGKVTAGKVTAGKATAGKATAGKATAGKVTAGKVTAGKAVRGAGPGEKGAGPAKEGRGKAAAKRPRKAAKAETAAGQAGGEQARRPYRRMPPAADVLAAYQQAGTISGLAEHFGVPRHTANSWAQRLRQQGHSIGRR